MTPWCVRDRSCRYDQGPESWGAPREDGYLRDDNSIIKKLPLPLRVMAPSGHPYNGRKPWRGFTACHVWRDLPGGRVAGEDPWLYSFIPNLVWLPSWLAPLTDRQGSATQRLLQHISLNLYRDVPTLAGLEEFAGQAWRNLPTPDSRALDVQDLAVFQPVPAFYQRCLAKIDLFVTGCNAALAGRPQPKKIICSRYTAGLPGLDASRVTEFRNALAAYAEAVRRGLATRGAVGPTTLATT